MYITVDFAEHAQYFRQKYEVDQLSVYVYIINRFFFEKFDANVEYFRQLRFQFHKFSENHTEWLFLIRTERTEERTKMFCYKAVILVQIFSSSLIINSYQKLIIQIYQ